MKRQFPASNIVLQSKKIKTDNMLEQDFINYISIPSLETMAVINVAVELCMQSDIKDKIRQHSLEFDPVGSNISHIRGTDHSRSFNEIEKNILNKLSLLPLPKLLKTKVSSAIRPIEVQILAWIRYDRKDIEYIDSIFWTTEGTIDKIKTLKYLIEKDTGQHIHSNFKLACTYCLEESIPNLWDKLSDKVKEDYLYGKRIFREYRNHLIAYWVASINNQFSGLISKLERRDDNGIYNNNHSLYNNMFALALAERNSLAVKHFWNKLTDVEICNNLKQWIDGVVNSMGNGYRGCQPTNACADIFYFLLSKLSDKEQQRDVLQQNSGVILNSLLNEWSRQRFFLPTIHVMWEFIDEQVYVQLLSRIKYQIVENGTVQMLLRKLWYDSPLDFRNRFIQHMIHAGDGTDVLCSLLRVEDVGTINALLNDANIEEKKQIIFALVERNRTNLRDVIYAGKISLFGDILIEVLSESDIKGIKETIVSEHGNILCHDWIRNNKWNMVECFFNWAFTAQDQIDSFKKQKINKIEVTFSLLRQGNIELVDKFMDWCFKSDHEIKRFKKCFAESKPEVVQIAEDWSSFEKFIDWCFDTEQEIKDFKSDVLRSYNLRNTIFDIVVYSYDFELVDKLLDWCCSSSEEIKQYKAEFVFSCTWMEILERFVNNYKIYDSEWSNWELVKKLRKLFPPKDDAINELKIKISSHLSFDFRGDFRNISYPIEERDLLRLMDDDSYSIGDDESSIDSGDDPGNEQDASNYYDEDPIVVQVLTDMLNEVESGS